MSGLESIVLQDGFSTAFDDLLNDFYIPCLSHATVYKRRAGYFNSGLIAIAPLVFADFVKRGGKMQLICNPHFKADDLEALKDSESILTLGRERAFQDLLSIKNSDGLGDSLSKALSSLIAAKVLELKILVPMNNKGLYHDKLGIFGDGTNHISFVGSTNETLAGWASFGNHENFEVFGSWRDEADSRRVRRHLMEFEILWTAPPLGWKFASPSDVEDLVYEVSPPGEVEVSLEELKVVLEKKIGKKFAQKLPFQSKILQNHQQLVLEDWRKHSEKGIVAFATGGGKTLTAISAIRDWGKKGNPSLVLVPSKLLHTQWQKELRAEIEDVQILPVGGGFPLKGLENVIRESSSNGPTVIVATYMTACKTSFLQSINTGSNLLIIGDEVHSAGQPTFRDFLETDFTGPRMGLSATPERYGDDEGTERVFNFFGKILEPRFTLEDAINAGRLTPYQYDFELVSLDSDEFEQWHEFTKRISRAMAMQGKNAALTDSVKRLLTERARISKKAQGKISVCYRIVKNNYKKGDRWLIYCSDRDQMTEVRSILSPLNYPLMDFHQAMLGARDETLEIFTREGGIMLAIKCLDEGVDIPSINRAVILASSTNPREYVQRRGRVLRSAPNKHSAHIWDVLVTNPQGKLITKFEAVRAIEFAGTSTSVSSKIALQSILLADKIEANVEEFEEDENED